MFLLLPILLDVPQTTVQPDSVRQVDHQIAGLELGQRVDRLAT